jgi:hypothetical protein
MSDAPSTNPEGDLRRRLRELLSVPERDRTDAQWDEIIELEVQLAPGNRMAPAPRGASSANPNANPGRQQPRKHGGPRPSGKRSNKPRR